MARVDRTNYQWTEEFLRYQAGFRQLSQASVERYRFYLRPLLLWAGETPLNKANQRETAFPAYVASQAAPSGGTLAFATQKKILLTARQFFTWARSRLASEFKPIRTDWIAMLRPSRQASQPVADEHIYVSLEDALRLATLPFTPSDLAAWRDRAAAARLFLSGERAGAFVTSPIQAIDLQTCAIRQWPELGVHTKFNKRATTYLLPIPELLEVVRAWDAFVRQNLPLQAAWYAPVISRWGVQQLSASDPGKYRFQALNKRLRLLFALAGLPFRSAHKFHHGHAVYGLLRARSMADYKAVSMNLMHNDLTITDSIYAPLLSQDVADRIQALADPGLTPAQNPLETLVDQLSNAELSKVMISIANRLAG